MSNRYVVNLQSDLLEQFRGKPNIEALVEVIGVELQEVYDFFSQLLIERDIKVAVGKQLDGIGIIADMTRSEAIALARDANYPYTDEDEMYRVFLLYKIFVNTAKGTYADVLRSIHMLWEGTLTYEEDATVPATIILNFERFNGLDIQRLLKVPIVKPAGVRILFRATGRKDHSFYTAGTITHSKRITYTQEEYDFSIPDILVDEDQNLLLDENGNILTEG